MNAKEEKEEKEGLSKTLKVLSGRYGSFAAAAGYVSVVTSGIALASDAIGASVGAVARLARAGSRVFKSRKGPAA